MSYVTKPIFVFDIDGVIVRNKKLLTKVGNRCSKFIHFMNKDKLDSRQSKVYNEKLYKTYGHSLKGFCIENKLESTAFITQIFNRYVYDDEILDELEKYVNSKEYKDINYDFMTFQDTCEWYKIPLYLYSNAPQDWCVRVAKSLNIETDNVYSSDHEVVVTELLYKPDMQSYTHVGRDILQKNRMPQLNVRENQSYINEIVFIDDSPKNLLSLADNKVWKPILFDPNNTYIEDSDINKIANIYELNPILMSKLKLVQ